jgi:hypothetical protein
MGHAERQKPALKPGPRTRRGINIMISRKKTMSMLKMIKMDLNFKGNTPIMRGGSKTPGFGTAACENHKVMIMIKERKGRVNNDRRADGEQERE